VKVRAKSGLSEKILNPRTLVIYTPGFCSGISCLCYVICGWGRGACNGGDSPELNL